MNTIKTGQLRLYLLFIWILISLFSHAQESIRDSLEHLLEGKLADTTRIQILLETAKITIGRDSIRADSLVQSAKRVSRHIKQIDDKVHAFEQIGSYYVRTSAYDSALTYYKKTLDVDKKQGNIARLARHHSNIGNVFFYKGEYNQTLYHFLQRLSYCEQLDDSTCISAASNNLGNALINLGRYQDAIDYTLRSLKIDEVLEYEYGILSSKMSLGNINYYLKNYDKAIEYFSEIVATCEALGNEQLTMTYAYNNLGSIFYQQKKFKKAAEFYEQSLVLEKQFGSKSGIATKYNNLGLVNKELGELERAEDYFHQALKIRQELGDLYGMGSSENNLGQLYLAQGNTQKALQFYNAALIHGEKAGSLETLKIANEGLAKTYKEQGQYAAAIKNYENFLSLNDSLLTIEKAEKITELEARYDSEKKENEIALLKKNEQLQEIQLVQQEASLRAGQFQRNILIAGLILLSIVVFLIVYSNKQRLAAKELVQKNQRETEKIRSRFFASISHEFRTPLTLISTPVQQLEKKYKDEKETVGMLGLIHQNANRLLKLVNQILDLSKLEVGKLQLTVEHGDIILWLRVISASFISLAESKDILFEQAFPQKGILSYFDREKIEQILSNLLSNAMKFTPKGGTVRLVVDVQDEVLRIAVQNTGAPISEKDQTRVFERFYQTDTQKYSEGTGIGLSLVKELTELHHGSVQVDSNIEHTTFSLTVPLSESAYENDIKIEPKANAPEKSKSTEDLDLSFPTEPVTEGEKHRVLLVEDQDDLRGYIGSQLGDIYEVKEAQNGHLAWEIALKELPDIIITDLMMPELDGEGLLEKLRHDPKTQHIPVILLTAKTERKSMFNSIGKGADHYLTKPFDIEELRIRMKSLLEQRKRIRDYHRSQFLTNPKAESITSMNDRFLQQAGLIMAKNLDNAEFTVDEFAAEMGMSRVQLFRKMKAIIGYSASDFIRQYRLKKAHEYLQHQKGTVSEIAYDVGFSNLSYFTRAFKEVYHCKPSDLLQKTT
ncbi:MAG: tetratricopeptide repeat protein [Bacteroidota bacterium]